MREGLAEGSQWRPGQSGVRAPLNGPRCSVEIDNYVLGNKVD